MAKKIIDFVIKENLVTAPKEKVLLWADDAEEKIMSFAQKNIKVKDSLMRLIISADTENYIGMGDDLQKIYDDFF